jgi:hypothetical protein
MPASETRSTRNVLLLGASGLGIGWLVGMSVSPVLAVVVTSLLAAAAAGASILSGIQKPESYREINVVPVFVLVLGIVIGSVFGVLTRTRSWLATPAADPTQTVLKWAALTGLPPQRVALLLFYQSTMRTPSNSQDLASQSGMYWSVGPDDTPKNSYSYSPGLTTQDSLQFSAMYDSLAKAYRPGPH